MSDHPYGVRPLDQTNPAPGQTPPRRPLGLRAQLMATRDAALRLGLAHVELAKSEFSAIGNELARAAAAIGVAIAVVIFAIFLVVIGTALFTSEWLLGSMGWGVVHGALLFTGIAVAATLAVLGVGARRIMGALVVAFIVGVVVSLLFGLDVPNRIYTAIGDAALPGIEPGVRPLVVGLVVWVLIGLALGIVTAFRLKTAGSRFGAILGFALVGAAFGAFSAITFSVQVGIGLGTTFGYATWIALMAIDVARTGVDIEALKARFYPVRTIETSKETLEWLQSKMPPGIGS